MVQSKLRTFFGGGNEPKGGCLLSLLECSNMSRQLLVFNCEQNKNVLFCTSLSLCEKLAFCSLPVLLEHVAGLSPLGFGEIGRQLGDLLSEAQFLCGSRMLPSS